MLDDDGTNSCIKNPDANDNRTFGLVSNDDYPNSWCPTRKCTILTIYYNNNNNHNSKNNVDTNFKGNDHSPFQVDYNSALTPTGSKLTTATERNAKDDNNKGSSCGCHDVAINNNKPENNVDNNSHSNKPNPCAASENNNDNNKDGNLIT